jgi:soluble lytic murein transglycosylase-like protein
MSPALAVVALQLLLGASPDEHAFDSEIDAAISAAQGVFVVPASLVRAVIKQESAFRPRALSKCGARGLMQVMPGNAAKLGLADADELWIPRLNLLAGVRLLAVLLKHYEGDVIASLVAYNSGPKARFAPVPANGETPEYVLRILRYWRAFESERTSPSGVPSSR